MLELFPATAAVTEGELAIGGIKTTALAEEFGTPLVVYCEQTLVDAARAYRATAPDALVVYGVKAFPNIALLDLFAGEGIGADVSTLGELTYATRAGIPGERIVVHGNNKSDEELRAAAEAQVRYVVLDALDEIDRAAEAGVSRVLVRVTPGIEADTHEAIRTAHRGSKFGLPPEQALVAIAAAQQAGLDVAGLHVHIGSQLLETEAALASVDRLASFSATARTELGWTPAVVDLGGGLGVRYVHEELPPRIEDFVSALIGRLQREWSRHELPLPKLVFEPGRSLVGSAGTTLYRVGAVKQASETTTYVAIDGGMSDNPRPQLYGARHSALLANRAEEPAAGDYVVCGKHCESGDVLIQGIRLPEPRRGDVLAVPATGGYTLGMGSNYNAVPRPAAVLVRKGEARLIRRRETIEDLLALDDDGRR
jgi:diaminopimelate decarboxylase